MMNTDIIKRIQSMYKYIQSPSVKVRLKTIEEEVVLLVDENKNLKQEINKLKEQTRDTKELKNNNAYNYEEEDLKWYDVGVEPEDECDYHYYKNEYSEFF